MKRTHITANCATKMIPNPCPMKWGSFAETDDEGVRHCDVCKRNVYFCNTDEDAIQHTKLGHCIAIGVVAASEIGTIMIGEGELPAPSDSQVLALEARRVDRAKIQSIRDSKYSDRDCSVCGYPIASFRKSCWVCDAKNSAEQVAASDR